jgi:hypothetical protein
MPHQQMIVPVVPEEKKVNIFEDLPPSFNCQEFKDILNQSNIVLSGSYVLKHYNNDKFVCSDVDVYCNDAKNIDAVRQYILNKMEPFDSRFKTALKNKRDARKMHSYNGMCGIEYVQNYPVDGIEIQLIKLRNGVDPVNYINENYDFSFCKVVYYNGEFHTNQDPEKMKLHVGCIDQQYIDAMETKKTDFGTVRCCINTLNRALKYIKRGYNITNLDAFVTLCKKAYCNSIKN